jgi:hypothetical protein
VFYWLVFVQCSYRVPARFELYIIAF